MGKWLIESKVCPRCGRKMVRRPRRCNYYWCGHKDCGVRVEVEQGEVTGRWFNRRTFKWETTKDKTSLLPA